MRAWPALALAVATLAAPLHAQDGGHKLPPAPPLIARYATAQGDRAIGGGPETEAVAAAGGNRLVAEVTGAAGAVPLLAQGRLLLAILPREMTPAELAATKRFTAGAPAALPIMQGLNAYARRDATGAIDALARDALAALLSPPGQAALANRLNDRKPLDPAALAAARAQLDGLPARPVPAGSADYRNADGSLAIIGSDTLIALFPDLLRGFAATDPAVRFTTDLRGSSIAMPALTAGTSAIAPMGRELWQNDLDAFREVKGYAPTRIRIAYSSHGPRADGKTPPAIYVNAGNPIAGLSMAQVKRVFAAGAPGGDARTWSDLATMAGQWRAAPIHVLGAPDDGGFATAMRQSKLDGLPFSARYRPMPGGKAILAAVAADPLAIGYVTWMDVGDAPAGVRLLPLAATAGDPFVLPGEGPQRGQWPISYFFNVYVDKVDGRPVPAAVKSLLRFLLSDDGQRIIAAHRLEENGYLPLDPADLAAERAKVDAL